MLTSGALVRSFTRAGLPCLLAASVLADNHWQEDGLVGREVIQSVALSRLDLPVVYPAGLDVIAPVSGDALLQVRACDAVTRLFSSSANFHFVFSSDARYLAAVVDGRRVFVWDLLACRTLPPLEMAGLADCVLTTAVVGGRATVRLLLAGSPGLGLATLVEAGPAERIHGIEGQWSLEFKPSETPLGGLTVHAFSGQVALLAQEHDVLSLWDLATLCGPQVRTLDGREGSEAGPRCVHITGLRNPLVACRFTPDGRQVALLRADGQLTLHATDRPGLQEDLAALASPHQPEAPLAIAPDGCRMAVGGSHGLLLWERANLRDLFGLPRATSSAEQTFGAGDVLEFTQWGDPVVLSRAGIVHWYDWEQANRSAELPLAGSGEKLRPVCLHRRLYGERR